MLELSDRDFKIIMINMLKDLMEKFYDIRIKMRHFSREMETIKNVK